MSDMIGPKPADSPKFPTPWTWDANHIYDAHGREVTTVLSEGDGEDDDELARDIAILVNRAHPTNEIQFR